MTIFLLVLIIIVLFAFLTLVSWYAKMLLKKLLFVSKNIYRMWETFEHFRSHVSAMHELEMYYGDQEIKNLIVHSQDVIKVINEFQNIYVLAEDGELEEIIMELDEQEEQEEQDKQEKQIDDNTKKKEEK